MERYNINGVCSFSCGYWNYIFTRGIMAKLLLIEDDKQLSAMYAQKFKKAGFSVSMTTDGQTGAQMALNNDFDLVVLDLMLPGLSGVEVLELIRSNLKTSKLPVIVYTNACDEKNKAKCLAYGADEFILKIDSTPDSLLKTIKKVVGNV